jgi:hypothetical protein
MTAARTDLWDEFHRAWRRVEAALRGANGPQSARGPIADLIEAAVRSHRITAPAGAELDAFRRLRNLDSHEGLAGSGARLCAPNPDAVQRLVDIADQLECPLQARQVMQKAALGSLNTPLGEVLEKFRNGAEVLYYRNGKEWGAFDRSQVSRIVERNARGAKTSLDLERPIGEYLKKIEHLAVIDLPADITARRAIDALRAAQAAAMYHSVIISEGRTVWHLTPLLAEEVERKLAR